MTKNTSEEQGDRELKNIKEIYNLPVLRIWWFQNTPLEQDRFLFGARLDFFDYDSLCYASKVKEAVHLRIHPNNINGCL